MGVLNWGGFSKIQIGKLGADDAAPTSWIDLDIPVGDSVQLETTEGEVQEAYDENGNLVDFKKKKNRYVFRFELFKKQGQSWPVEDTDGKIDGYYAMRFLPEDDSIDGIKFAKSVMSAGDSFNVADGQRKPYTMNVINASTGKTILPCTKSEFGA
ncbi:MAG: hypothetical protein IJ640_09280 [Prevotella sp.]|nr:hypothetical protein [Prevotella sp.]